MFSGSTSRRDDGSCRCMSDLPGDERLLLVSESSASFLAGKVHEMFLDAGERRHHDANSMVFLAIRSTLQVVSSS